MMYMKLVLTAWFLLTASASAQADTKVIVLFDTSYSMKQAVQPEQCLGPYTSCVAGKGIVQFQAFRRALAAVRKPACTNLQLKLVHWNVMVRYVSSWNDISLPASRQQLQQLLLRTRPKLEGKSNQLHAFRYATRLIGQDAPHEYAVIMVSDGKPSDGWQKSYGYQTALKQEFLFFDLVFQDSMTMRDMQRDFKNAFALIEERLHGCTS